MVEVLRCQQFDTKGVGEAIAESEGKGAVIIDIHVGTDGIDATVVTLRRDLGDTRTRPELPGAVVERAERVERAVRVGIQRVGGHGRCGTESREAGEACQCQKLPRACCRARATRSQVRGEGGLASDDVGHDGS